MKVEASVKKETGILLAGTLCLCGVMVCVFLLLHRFDYTVVTGALLGGLAAVLNFFVMGLTIQNAVGKSQDEAKKRIQLSYTVRMFVLLAVLGAGVYLPYFHWLAVLLSALFPRVTILFRSVLLKKQSGSEPGGDGEA